MYIILNKMEKWIFFTHKKDFLWGYRLEELIVTFQKLLIIILIRLFFLYSINIKMLLTFLVPVVNSFEN